MNKIIASLFAGLPLVVLACVASVSEENHPCPCASGWTCCASSEVCVDPGATCPTGDGGSAVAVGDHGADAASAKLPDATSDLVDAGNAVDASDATAHMMDASMPDSTIEAAVFPVFPDASASNPTINPIFAGDGGLCNWSPQVILGTKVTLNVGVYATTVNPVASGLANIWLLLSYAADGRGTIAGTIQTCGMQMPAIPLSAVGDMAAGLETGTIGELQTTIPARSWDGTPTTPITGTQGGSNIGSTFAIDPLVTLYGLKPTSTLASASQTWPRRATDLVASDLTYPDGSAYQTGEGEPGIFALPLDTPPDVLPPTSLSGATPPADQLWLVLRTQLSLYGTIESCGEQAGTVEVNKLDSHVVGCSLVDAGACAPTDYDNIDVVRPEYGVPVSGTFEATPMAVGAGCTDVLAALP